ncbi:hypothetical protein GALL_111620 [mine drainage metagenome]|uniref:Uncharacterized protein n=1 Tax=mine drainage metagenome TaxID=410659 RepID=A0A1J5SRA3_9ZZZZ
MNLLQHRLHLNLLSIFRQYQKSRLSKRQLNLNINLKINLKHLSLCRLICPLLARNDLCQIIPLHHVEWVSMVHWYYGWSWMKLVTSLLLTSRKVQVTSAWMKLG